jgi:predicted RNase H-like nuclease (RuvC/YqgF family)
MATTKRGKKARAGARKPTAARGKSASARKRASAKSSTKAGKRPAAAKTAKKAGAKAAAGGGAALAQQKARFDRERDDLQKRLTDMVREIGELRHHEMRATQLARQVAERDQTIAGLRRELSELRSRPAAAPTDQASLDFGSEELRVDDLDESVSLDDEDDDLM